MLVVTDKTIGFTSDGTLLIFDSRDEFAEWAKDKNDYEVWAEPKWLFNTLREQEKVIEELECDNENMTRDSIRRRGIKAREDVRQRKILERGEEEDNNVD